MSSKQVQMTAEIEAQLRAAIDDQTFDVSKVAVFEARALSTQPIQRKSGFHKGARVSHSTLTQMAQFLNTPGKAVPLQIMHNNEVLPVGKVFAANIMEMSTGDTELRTLFYIPKDKTQLISDIESSLIDEVSVGLMTDKAICSECDFDYFGKDADIMNFYTLTCSEGHVIGEDGTHVRLVGMKDWGELSLVGRGAAKDAKIFSRAKQAMGKDAVDRLAASGSPVDARVLTVNYKLEAQASNETNKGDSSMDKETLALFQANVTELTTTKSDLTATVTKLTATEAELAEVKTQLSAKETELNTLKAANEQATELAAKVTGLETEMTELSNALLPHAKAALIASGVAETDLPNTALAMIKVVEEKGLKLHQVFASEPKSDGSKAGVEKQIQLRNDAFKTRN
jgi:hypothetical protein